MSPLLHRKDRANTHTRVHVRERRANIRTHELKTLTLTLISDTNHPTLVWLLRFRDPKMSRQNL